MTYPQASSPLPSDVTAPMAGPCTSSSSPSSPSSPFWSGALQGGVHVVIGQFSQVDELATRVRGAGLAAAVAGGPRRLLLDQYDELLRGMSAAWPQRTRPALLMGLGALRAFADSMAGAEGMALAEAMHRAAACREHAGDAAKLAASLEARLARLLSAFDALASTFACYGRQMNDAARRLEHDSLLVTQRLQADHVHASVLSQQVATVGQHLQQGQKSRQHGATPSEPSTSPLLDSAQRQLTRLRASQAGLIEDAVGLQCMLPALSNYLGAVERMGLGMNAALQGARQLHAALAELDAAALDAPSVAATSAQQLMRAKPHWAALAMRLAASAELADHHA